MIGKRLGPYEVLSKLGAGGMGEVYRATDTDLKRAVAIKVLPDALTRDADRLARFQREAEILAALDHPHIAHVHGLQKTGDHIGLVMELVEGPTLADRIKSGPLAVDDALTIARQIAEAVESAHDRGIVHRDLKPANIKIRPDGCVKVLDFGLAKLIDTAAPEGQESDLSTVTGGALTRDGMVLGTPAYMAPEQVRGSAVDRRADIWAFGCVLYEMLTGRRAFEGASVPDTLAAVIGTTPDWSRIPDAVPVPLRTLLQRCLARDVRQRVSQMAVVRFALAQQDDIAATSALAARSRQRPRRFGIATVGIALLAAAITAAAFLLFSPRRSPARVLRATIPESTFIAAMDRTYTMTRDGTRLVFVSADASEIRVRPLDAMDAATLLDTSGFIHCLFSSPDSQWIGYVENNYSLKKIPIAGGAPVTVLMMDGPARGADWGPDDSMVYATGETATGLQRVSARGGAATVLTKPDRDRGESDHVGPAWLPNGRGVLFTILSRTGGLGAAKVAIFDVASGTSRELIPSALGARYVEGGYLLYASAGALWALRFDQDRMETRGTAVKVLPDVAVGGMGGIAHIDVSDNGTLLYPRGAKDYYARTRVPVWVDRQGRETPIAAPKDAYQMPRLSPDDTRVAFTLLADIYILDLTRPNSVPARFTSTPGGDWFAVWVPPDGRRILYGSWRGGGLSNIYSQYLDSAEAERLTDSPDMQSPTSMTPDGKILIFHSFPKDLHQLVLGPPRETTTLVGSPVEERNGVLSPDGRWLAYEGESSQRPGRMDVFVRAFPEVNRGAWQITSGGGTFPAWSRDGKELYYLKPDRTFVAVPVEASGTAWKAGTPVELFKNPYFVLGDGPMARHYDVARDGRFLMLKDTAPTSPSHFVLVQDWIAELVAKVQ